MTLSSCAAGGACFALLTLAALAAAGPATAGFPDPANSTVPCGIQIVPAGVPETTGAFTVAHRDLANNPVPNAPITIDFSGCGSEVRIAGQQQPGTIVDCAARTVTRFTDAQGLVTFRVIGASNGAPSIVGGPCAAVSGPGGLLATIQAAVFDLDGANGLTIADLAVLLGDFFNRPVPPDYAARSDYNYFDTGCSQDVGVPDLSIWLNVYFAQTAVVPATLCGP